MPYHQRIFNISDKLQSYHAVNFGSLLLMLAYTKLSTDRNQLLENGGINMATLHVVGDIGTGKSKGADHIRSLLPYSVDRNGRSFIHREDNPSEAVLNEDLSQEGAPLIYDPALKLPPSTLNEVLDNSFQVGKRILLILKCNQLTNKVW